MRTRAVACFIAGLAATLQAVTAGETALNTNLVMLRPLLGKTMKGELTGSTPEKPVVDVQHWERALNGQAVRLTHSVNNGAYGGETLFVWDEKKQIVAYYYFTTAGFMTSGTLKSDAGHWIASETVSGNAHGVTETRSTSELLADGRLHVKAEYLKDGKWTFGHEATYAEAPDSKVLFR